VAILAIIPMKLIARLWYYLLTVAVEFAGVYFLVSSAVYWVRQGAQVGM
jgi:hypothetical protein